MVNTFVLGKKLKYLDYLDNLRLGKQRVEAHQIIQILEYYDEYGEMPDRGWVNHKVTKMWIGHTKSLKMYFNETVKFWINRGFKNNYELYENVDCEIIECNFDGVTATFEREADENTFPIWFSFPPLHYAYRAALFMKDENYYSDLLNSKIEKYIGRGYLWPSDYDERIYKKWKMSYLADPGEGLPSHYRLEKSLVKKWLNDKTKNPKTGRNIEKGKKTYNDYKKAAIYYKLI